MNPTPSLELADHDAKRPRIREISRRQPPLESLAGRIRFVAGLPRSGSTLLMNLLGQHPGHHVTPSSGLIDMIVMIRNQWMHNTWFKAEGLENVKPHILSMMKAMICGFHQEPLAANKSVFDKNRGWIAYVELLEQIFGEPMKILVTVRDIKAIVASFEKIHRKDALSKHVEDGDAYFQCQTIEGRARQLLAPGAVVGLAVNRLRDAIDRGLSDRLVVVPYRRLTTEPTQAMTAIHHALGLPAHEYDTANVSQLTHEDDTVHGMDLHSIRPRVEPYQTAPWDGVLPVRVCDWLDNDYADVNRMACL